MGLKPDASIPAELLLGARRAADQPDADGNRSLWVVMNPLEENIVRGSTKAVRLIDLDLKIRGGLRELAWEFAELN